MGVVANGVGAGAQATAQKEMPQQASPTVTADDLYESAVGLLKEGRDFERAAAQLRKALAMQDRMPYHIALGCALADRAAGLAQASVDRVAFERDQKKYQDWLARWEAAQKDPLNPEYGQPRPEPPALQTRDDHRPFTLTPKEAKSRFKSLTAEAMEEWERAFALAKTPQEQAELKYVRGWGRELIREYGGFALWTDLPEQDDSIRDMMEATQAAPGNPTYWQSLGDIRMGFDGADRTRNRPAALTAYYQAFKLQKTNAPLCYRIYDLCKQDDPLQAKEAIYQAAQLEPDNAYPAYRFAGLMLYDTPFCNYDKTINLIAKSVVPISTEEWKAIGTRILEAPNYARMRQAAEMAMGYVERGNRAGGYTPPTYDPQFPRLLRAAWEYEKGRYYDKTTDITDWHRVSVSVGGYIRVVIRQGDKEAGEHAAHLLIDMGAKIVGELDKKPLPLPSSEWSRVSRPEYRKDRLRLAGDSLQGGGRQCGRGAGRTGL